MVVLESYLQSNPLRALWLRVTFSQHPKLAYFLCFKTFQSALSKVLLALEECLRLIQQNAVTLKDSNVRKSIKREI